VRTLLATIAVVLSISGAVLYASEAQRSVGELNFREAQTAKEMAVKLLARNATLQRSLTEGRVSAQEVLPFFAGNRQVDEALARLKAEDPELERIVVMKFFGGLSNEEIAESLGLAKRTLDRQWAYARAWLFRRISEEI